MTIRESITSKKIAIVQSNYIPWKGYFDMIAAVDEFILYDDAQFTKNDWRNRNKIKTPNGIEWISVPVGKNISRRIRDVELPSPGWQQKHWRTLESNYRRCPHFDEVASVFKPLYQGSEYRHLSELNRKLIEAVCEYLGIGTIISNSWEYTLTGGRTERLANLCVQAGGTKYISGPSARDYLDERIFVERGINLSWFDYAGYPEYPQPWGDFQPAVTVLDLLFNCGKNSPRYMKYVK
jgi:hypothetical protein